MGLRRQKPCYRTSALSVRQRKSKERCSGLNINAFELEPDVIRYCFLSNVPFQPWRARS
jgi:hypothetical protein